VTDRRATYIGREIRARVNDDMLDRIDALAVRLCTNRAHTMRILLEQGLDMADQSDTPWWAK
jgi:hypothetical protein